MPSYKVYSSPSIRSWIKKKTGGCGFTLIEVLISLVIFSILSVMAYGGLNSILKTRKQVEAHASRLEQLERTFYFLGKDIEQSVLRGIRDEIGEKQPAFRSTKTGDFRLELTRMGWRNPAQMTRSTLQRVAYTTESEKLFRIYWAHLDRPQKIEPQKILLLDKVKQLSFLFYDNQLKTHESWPQLKKREEGASSSIPDILPQAVEVAIELEDWGEFKRLFVLADGK
ncbi:MAG: type II secretion system minor pseudopilin GspJ [Gammaproteobacteria bacterium]|nr:type II secretion system minor pseudopilin GspJ [Gammaproteobacteria bacterium]